MVWVSDRIRVSVKWASNWGDLDIGEFWGVDLKYGVSIKLVAREKLLSGAISYTTLLLCLIYIIIYNLLLKSYILFDNHKRYNTQPAKKFMIIEFNKS